MPWKYSGNKRSMLKHLPAPPAGTETIVEPFAGSMAYSLGYRPRQVILAEGNEDVRELWNWVVSPFGCSVQQLTDLEAAKPTEKVDIRTIGLIKPAETLMRLSISGVYTGQLSSYIAYPQHKFDLTRVKESLPYLQNSVDKLVRSDFRDTVDEKGLFFIDPPYLGTKGNYIDKTAKKDRTKGFTVQELSEFVTKVRDAGNPVLFTYGDDAPEKFPEFNWTLAKIKKVPKIRTGGVVERREWYYCSWLD